jgi:hypothetical protein
MNNVKRKMENETKRNFKTWTINARPGIPAFEKR